MIKISTLIEIGVTSGENLTIVENGKLRKYDILANELGMIYKCKTRIVPYVITWDGLVTKFHKQYCILLEIPAETAAYTQTIALKKTLELIFFDWRKEKNEEDKESEVEKSVESIMMIRLRDIKRCA
ncbi:hypothetical protein COBT_003609 [Conglomerata obtusa]